MTTSSQKNRDAKEACLWSLFDGYPNFKATDEFIERVLDLLEPYSPRAVEHAVRRFGDGGVPGHNTAFVPNGPQIAEQARLFHELYTREVVPLYSGIIEMDFGHGRVDMRGLTVEEQDEVIRRHGVIDGKNVALLSLEDKRAALKQQALAAPVATPRIKRITDA